jgi:hypothetical protein
MGLIRDIQRNATQHKNTAVMQNAIVLRCRVLSIVVLNVVTPH